MLFYDYIVTRLFIGRELSGKIPGLWLSKSGHLSGTVKTQTDRLNSVLLVLFQSCQTCILIS